jgi:hypothetical protein
LLPLISFMQNHFYLQQFPDPASFVHNVVLDGSEW